MTIMNCPTCGGTHIGSSKCPYIEAPCVVCGAMTILACSDCAIDSGGKTSVHVCKRKECRDTHEKIHKAKARPSSLPTPEAFEALAQKFDSGTNVRYGHPLGDADEDLAATACRIAAKVNREGLVHALCFMKDGEFEFLNERDREWWIEKADAIIAYLTDQPTEGG